MIHASHARPVDRILVLGAGELGMAMLLALAPLDKGVAPLSVLVRPASLAASDEPKRRALAEIRELGVEMVPGDLGDPANLAALLAPFDIVIGCTGFAGGRGTQLGIARAVFSAGIERYIPWQFGLDYDAIGRGSAQDLFDEQLDVRDLLRRQSGTRWTIVSTGLFTSFLFDPAFGVVDLDNDVVCALGSWDNSVTVTGPEDIAKVVAEIVGSEPAAADGIVYAASDTVTYGQIADVVDAHLGRAGGRKGRVEPSSPEDRAVGASRRCDPKIPVVFAEGRRTSWLLEQTFNAAWDRNDRLGGLGEEEYRRKPNDLMVR